MDVANVINHHTPAMRALRRVAGSSDLPPAPLERSGEDVGIPAPLFKEGADRRQRDTRERPGRELDRKDHPAGLRRRGPPTIYRNRKKVRTFSDPINARVALVAAVLSALSDMPEAVAYVGVLSGWFKSLRRWASALSRVI